jgi:flavin reductase (DIM6/NTAB) family NADH-FMN oxidoreductase RutF
VSSTLGNQPAGSGPPNEADYRDVIGRFASGVTIITAVHEGRDHGATASAVASLSLEPPMLVVCLNRSSATARAAELSGAFAVNILGEDHADLAVRFAQHGADKFSAVTVRRGDRGVPLIIEALANLECRITDQVQGGTHWVFLAAVEAAAAHAGPPLAYFRGEFGRLEVSSDESVYAHLRERILTRRIDVGSPLELDALAVDASATRGAVFHGLSKLIGEGLVARTGDGEFVVRPLTSEAARDATQARFAMMLGVAYLTVGRISPPQLAELRRLVALTEPDTEDSRTIDVAPWARATRRFLDYVVGLAGSTTLVDSFRRASVSALIIQLAPGEGPLDLAGAHRSHVDLVDAYKAADTAAAVVAVRAILGVVLGMVDRMFAETSEI